MISSQYMYQKWDMRATEPVTSLGLHSFERRELRDHDIMIDIHYCGICHTDILSHEPPYLANIYVFSCDFVFDSLFQL